jgi:hypothetical protein
MRLNPLEEVKKRYVNLNAGVSWANIREKMGDMLYKLSSMKFEV